MNDSSVVLQHGALRLALRPDCGGAITGLWLDDLPVLRSCEPHQLTEVRASACYALVPYSNRIAQRRFSWLGRQYTLASNSDEPHNLHGTGWLVEYLKRLLFRSRVRRTDQRRTSFGEATRTQVQPVSLHTRLSAVPGSARA